MKCQFCGAENGDNKFCGNCGAQIRGKGVKRNGCQIQIEQMSNRSFLRIKGEVAEIDSFKLSSSEDGVELDIKLKGVTEHQLIGATVIDRS